MKKKWMIGIVLGVLVLGGGGYWAYQLFKPEPVTGSLITTTVKQGDVKQMITATGTVRYPEEVPLSFEQAGTVKEVYVQAGDTVTAGQVLAQMDTETLQQEVSESEANLKDAELSWQQQKLEAESALIKAQQALKTAEQNADPTTLANQVALAEQNVQVAKENLEKAQKSGDAASIQQVQSTLSQAETKLVTAQNAQNGGAAQSVELAKADLSLAEVKLNRLAEKTSLTQAQTAVVKARENLNKATLVASADGVIIDVAIKEGQTINANANTAAMTLATGGNLLVVDSSVSQAEVAEIEAGQKVDITLDSAPDEHMIATVSQVAMKATTNQNVTTFNVTIQMDEASDLLLPGMNVNVGIIVAEAKDVQILPSQAIQTQGKQKGVLVTNSTEAPSASNGRQSQGGSQMANAETRFVPLEIGLDDGTNVEIKSGLTEGQVVVVGTRSTATTTNTNSNTNARAGAIPGVTGAPNGFGGAGRLR